MAGEMCGALIDRVAGPGDALRVTLSPEMNDRQRKGSVAKPPMAARTIPPWHRLTEASRAEPARIEAKMPSRLDEITEAATTAIVARFGSGPIESSLSTLVCCGAANGVTQEHGQGFRRAGVPEE